MEKKEEENKIEKKLKGDSGYNCNYCNGYNHHVQDYMLRKKEEKKEKVKYEAYYSMKLEEFHTKSKNLSLMVKGVDDNKGTYQIWSYGSDDDDMHHPTHGVLFVKYEEGESERKSLAGDDEEDIHWEYMEKEKGEESEEEDEELTGKCFVTTTPKSPLTTKIRDLLVSLNVPLNYYHAILSHFNETCSYLNDILISRSSEAEKSKSLLYEVDNKLEEKNSEIEGLEFKITNIMTDRDSIRMDNCMFVKQRNIDCNIAKYLYGKLTNL